MGKCGGGVMEDKSLAGPLEGLKNHATEGTIGMSMKCIENQRPQ